MTSKLSCLSTLPLLMGPPHNTEPRRFSPIIRLWPSYTDATAGGKQGWVPWQFPPSPVSEAAPRVQLKGCWCRSVNSHHLSISWVTIRRDVSNPSMALSHGRSVAHQPIYPSVEVSLSDQLIANTHFYQQKAKPEETKNVLALMTGKTKLNIKLVQRCVFLRAECLYMNCPCNHPPLPVTLFLTASQGHLLPTLVHFG